ncbi:hypothetical protein QBC39DRAFT_355741 [Podospora conica]|nr:hypothetical protein QBC39DRAFT_355741 [Schizothecium conicum]
MTPAPDSAPSFSHDVAVTTITRYCRLIDRLHGPGTTKYPPAGGWTQVEAHLGEHLNLGPEAVRLIRYLPHCEYHIVPECRPRNYPAGFDHVLATIAETKKPPRPEYEGFPELDPEFPPHIFELAGGGYRMGCRLAIDTKRGVAIWHNTNEDSLAKGCPEPDAAPEIDFDPDPEAHEPLYTHRGWRAAPTYRIETFFAMAEEQLKLLNWIPRLDSGGGEIDEPRVYGVLDEEQQGRIKIMKDAGWPAETWDYFHAPQVTWDWIDARIAVEMAADEKRRLPAGL